MRTWWRRRSCWLVLVPFFATGCEQTSDAPQILAPSFPGINLRIGAMDDVPILAGVRPQLGEWEASRRGNLLIHDEPVTLQSVTEVDIVLFPAQRLGDLVDKGALAKIPNAAVVPPKPAEIEPGDKGRRDQDQAGPALDDVFRYMDIAPAFREQVSRYGPDRLALPCGGSALVLVYRRDAFERAPTKRRQNRQE